MLKIQEFKLLLNVLGLLKVSFTTIQAKILACPRITIILLHNIIVTGLNPGVISKVG